MYTCILVIPHSTHTKHITLLYSTHSTPPHHTTRRSSKSPIVIASCGWDKTIQFHPFVDAMKDADEVKGCSEVAVRLQ